jgi:glycosyltransferase involved in cell wall biosynthesis
VRVGLVVLNRNEREALPVILPKLDRDAVDMVFAVDGHSTDDSVAILRQHGVEVLAQRSPGRGEAFRLAFEHARDAVDALIFFSPDGNEDPADVPRFRPLLEAGNDMVIASRMMPGAVNEEDHRRIRLRKWANLGFNELAYRTWAHGRPKITDPINGYRAITVDAWDQLQPDGAGYTIEYQTSIRAYQLGLRVAEFPTEEGQRIGGASNATAIRTGTHFLQLYAGELRRTRRGRR